MYQPVELLAFFPLGKVSQFVSRLGPFTSAGALSLLSWRRGSQLRDPYFVWQFVVARFY